MMKTPVWFACQHTSGLALIPNAEFEVQGDAAFEGCQISVHFKLRQWVSFYLQPSLIAFLSLLPFSVLPAHILAVLGNHMLYYENPLPWCLYQVRCIKFYRQKVPIKISLFLTSIFSLSFFNYILFSFYSDKNKYIGFYMFNHWCAFSLTKYIYYIPARLAVIYQETIYL